MNSSEIQILRLREVVKRVGLSKPSIYRFLKDGLFPKPIRLGERAVGWPASEIDEWLANRPRTTGEVGRNAA